MRFTILENLNKWGIGQGGFQKYGNAPDSPISNQDAPWTNLQLEDATRRVGTDTPDTFGRAGERVMSGDKADRSASVTEQELGDLEDDIVEKAEPLEEEELGLPAYSKRDKSPEAKQSRRDEANARLESGEGKAWDTWKGMNKSQKIGAALEAFSEFAAVASSKDPSQALADMMSKRARQKEIEFEAERRKAERAEDQAFMSGQQAADFAHDQEMARQTEQLRLDALREEREYEAGLTREDREWQKVQDQERFQREKDLLDISQKHNQEDIRLRATLDNQNLGQSVRNEAANRLNIRAEDAGLELHSDALATGASLAVATSVQAWKTDCIREGQCQRELTADEQMAVDGANETKRLRRLTEQHAADAAQVEATTQAYMMGNGLMAEGYEEAMSKLTETFEARDRGIAGHGETEDPSALMETLPDSGQSGANREKAGEALTALRQRVAAGDSPDIRDINRIIKDCQGVCDPALVAETAVAAGASPDEVRRLFPVDRNRERSIFEPSAESEERRMLVDPLLTGMPQSITRAFRDEEDPISQLSIDEQHAIATRLKEALRSGYSGNDQRAMQREMEIIREEFGFTRPDPWARSAR
jgi:hypothetical protein